MTLSAPVFLVPQSSRKCLQDLQVSIAAFFIQNSGECLCHFHVAVAGSCHVCEDLLRGRDFRVEFSRAIGPIRDKGGANACAVVFSQDYMLKKDLFRQNMFKVLNLVSYQW